MVNALILLAIFVVIVILDMKDDTVKNKCKNSKLSKVLRSGSYCVYFSDYCVDQNCNFGVCIGRFLGFDCQCDPGYEGELCETEIASFPDSLHQSEQTVKRFKVF